MAIASGKAGAGSLIFLMTLCTLLCAAEDADPNAINRGSWIWESASWVSAKARNKLFHFYDSNSFNRLLIQIHPKVTDDGIILEHTAAMRDILERAAARNIKVYALDGAAVYVLPENYLYVSAVIEAIARFNVTQRVDARFAGVHYDNEPYLLEGWKDTAKRPKILTDWLESTQLFSHISRLNALQYGIDIPFWLDSEEVTQVEYQNGKSDSFLEDLISHTDWFAIMSYRNTVSGEGGLLDITETEIALANKLGIKAWVGLETLPLEPAHITFANQSVAYFRKAVQELEGHLQEAPAYGGLLIHYYGNLNRYLTAAKRRGKRKAITRSELRSQKGQKKKLLEEFKQKNNAPPPPRRGGKW